MSITRNIDNFLDESFKNHDYLPQRLLLEDMDDGLLTFLRSLEISVMDEKANTRAVPVIFLTQERWAEFRNNFKYLRDEAGQEITMPFMTLRRKGVKPGENPLKRSTIPKKKKFTFLQVPTFDGLVKGYDIYKVPQPPRVDIDYELRFFSHYMEDTNVYYEEIIANTFSDKEAYININGYPLFTEMSDPSEENTVDDIEADRRFSVVVPMTLHGKIVDPRLWEKVQAINKIRVDISEGGNKSNAKYGNPVINTINWFVDNGYVGDYFEGS
jgi:hypothetical protein